MDEAFNQYASHVRRKNRSTTNLNRLTLAPLTAKFPLADADEVAANLPDHLLAMTSTTATMSYLQGRSAPTTPGLISHSPGPYSRSSSRPRAPKKSAMKRSKSTTQLANALAITSTESSISGAAPPRRLAKSGYATPNPNHPNNRRRQNESFDNGPGDSDWLLRAGAMLSTEAREYKGQSWLVSRESSTSLAGMGLGVHNADAEAFERELARERAVASRMASRRGSVQFEDDEDAQEDGKRTSRRGSRPGSRSGLWSQAMTPLDHSPHMNHHHHRNSAHYHTHSTHSSTDYFAPTVNEATSVPGPDFVNLDEKLEGLAQDHRDTEGDGGSPGGQRKADDDDEAVVRKLVRRGNSGLWSMFGFSLFSVAENDGGEDDEEEEEEEEEEEYYDDGYYRSARRRARGHLDGHDAVEDVDRVPPPGEDEGGWKDAAWLLSVASRVLL